MKNLFYVFIFIAFALVTFFGLGPVILADGAMSERLMTLLVVILIYVLLGWITVKFNKRQTSGRS